MSEREEEIKRITNPFITAVCSYHIDDQEFCENLRKDESELNEALALSEAKRLRVLLEGLKCSKGCEHDISDDQQDNGCSHCHCYHWDNDGFNKIIDQAIKANCEEAKDEV